MSVALKIIQKIQNSRGKNNIVVFRNDVQKCLFYFPRFRFVYSGSVRHQRSWSLPSVNTFTRDAAVKHPAFPRQFLWRHTNWTHHQQIRQRLGHNWSDGSPHHDQVCWEVIRDGVHLRAHCVQYTTGACGTGTTDRHLLPHTGTVCLSMDARGWGKYLKPKYLTAHMLSKTKRSKWHQIYRTSYLKAKGRKHVGYFVNFSVIIPWILKKS